MLRDIPASFNWQLQSPAGFHTDTEKKLDVAAHLQWPTHLAGPLVYEKIVQKAMEGTVLGLCSGCKAQCPPTLDGQFSHLPAEPSFRSPLGVL